MENVAIVLAFFLMGVACRHVGFPKDAGSVLTKFAIFVSLPCLTLSTIHSIALTATLVIPALAIWLTVLAGMLYFGVVGSIFGLSRNAVGALILAASFSNTGFIGIPIVGAVAGEQFVGLALWLDQAGSYLALNTIGLLIAVYAAAQEDGRLTLKDIVVRIIAFPPIVAMALALALRPIAFPPVVDSFLSFGAATLVPIALFAVGIQLSIGDLQGRWMSLGAALAYCLVIAPAIALFVFVGGFGITTEEMKVTVLEAAMGPQIGAAAVAIQYRLEPHLVAGIVGIGIPASLATTQGWWWALTYIGL